MVLFGVLQDSATGWNSETESKWKEKWSFGSGYETKDPDRKLWSQQVSFGADSSYAAQPESFSTWPWTCQTYADAAK